MDNFIEKMNDVFSEKNGWFHDLKSNVFLFLLFLFTVSFMAYMSFEIRSFGLLLISVGYAISLPLIVLYVVSQNKKEYLKIQNGDFVEVKNENVIVYNGKKYVSKEILK